MVQILDAEVMEMWHNRYGTKYGSRKTEVDGILFDSRREASRYSELKMLERGKAITGLQLQPEFELQAGFRDNKGVWRRPITYKADFLYIEEGKTIVEDVKGMQTDVFKIKMKMFLKQYPTIDFRIVK